MKGMSVQTRHNRGICESCNRAGGENICTPEAKSANAPEAVAAATLLAPRFSVGKEIP
jgi:hypothetical protein